MTAFPRLTAAATALALGLTSLTATPAAAMNDNDRAALALILGIGALAVLSDQNDKRRAAPVRMAPPKPSPQIFGHRANPDVRRDDRRRADACEMRLTRDHHGRLIRVPSPGCRVEDRHQDWSGRPYRR